MLRFATVARRVATCCMFASPYQLDRFMEEEREELNPNAMTAEQAALLFSKLTRRRVEVEQVQADIDAGAPTDENWPTERADLCGLVTQGDESWRLILASCVQANVAGC